MYILFFSLFIPFISYFNIFQKVLGISICTLFIGFIRVPNLKLLVLLLTLLFFYDIFWVFYSSYFFGSNVMEKVATQKTSNPINVVVASAPSLISLPSSITSILTFFLFLSFFLSLFLSLFSLSFSPFSCFFLSFCSFFSFFL